MTSKDKALALANAIVEKKAFDIRIFDLRPVSSFTDFFVIATGTSRRHVQALADAAVELARGIGERPLGVEGERPGRWILVDLGDVVMHLFDAEARDFYALERLWDEAETVDWPAAAAGAVGGTW